MGNRRIGRKRLYAVEKAGQRIDLESGAGIAGAIKSATQQNKNLTGNDRIVIEDAAS